MARMSEQFFTISHQAHHDLIVAAYLHRGFTADEAEDAARFCDLASTHGIRTHNGIKALHLDEHFGSKAGGCVPGAQIEEIPTRFAASKVWNANRKLGQSSAFRAMEEAISRKPKGHDFVIDRRRARPAVGRHMSVTGG